MGVATSNSHHFQSASLRFVRETIGRRVARLRLRLYFPSELKHMQIPVLDQLLTCTSDVKILAVRRVSRTTSLNITNCSIYIVQAYICTSANVYLLSFLLIQILTPYVPDYNLLRPNFSNIKHGWCTMYIHYLMSHTYIVGLTVIVKLYSATWLATPHRRFHLNGTYNHSRQDRFSNSYGEGAKQRPSNSLRKTALCSLCRKDRSITQKH